MDRFGSYSPVFYELDRFCGTAFSEMLFIT